MSFGSSFHYGGNSSQPAELRRSKQTIERYFIGPRDIGRHSKWPRALRMHGSVMPKLILPTFCVSCWATLVTAISEKIHSIAVHPIVLTVLGLVVGLALNFRSSTAYERYMDGRKMWSSLGAVSQNLARVVWIHTEERDGRQGKKDLIAKITCLNMIIAFAVALKHRLRFEPYVQYEDLNELVSHLQTFAREAGTPSSRKEQENFCKQLGELLRIPMARSNPRKELKRATRPLGNLPLEILSYISAYINETITNGTFPLAIAKTHALNNMQSLNEILTTTDRVLNTPLPVAYAIAIHQVTWIYIISLPFQLVNLMGWTAIPVTSITAYIILGIAAIGNEIENPFGSEVNNLPVELYCAQIASEVTIIASKPKLKPHEYWAHPENRPLYPISSSGYDYWIHRDEAYIRDALSTRASVSKSAIWKRQASWVARDSTSTAESTTVCGDCSEGTCKVRIPPTTSFGSDQNYAHGCCLDV